MCTLLALLSVGEPGEILPARAFNDCNIFMGVRLATGCRCLLRSVSFILEEDRIIVRLRFEGVNPQTLLYVHEQATSRVSENCKRHRTLSIHESRLRSETIWNLSTRNTHSSRGLSTPTTRKHATEKIGSAEVLFNSYQQRLIAINSTFRFVYFRTQTDIGASFEIRCGTIQLWMRIRNPVDKYRWLIRIFLSIFTDNCAWLSKHALLNLINDFIPCLFSI